MNFITKIEDAIAKVAKDLPHLPVGGRKWLGDNVWWIVAIGVGISALASLVNFFNIINMANALNKLSAFIPINTITTQAMTAAIVTFALVVIEIVILAFAIKPLKEKQKKGWTLLFVSILVSALTIIVSAVVGFDVLSLILSIIFGGVILAAVTYFVFEIRDQFGASTKSTPVAASTANSVDSPKIPEAPAEK